MSFSIQQINRDSYQIVSVSGYMGSEECHRVEGCLLELQGQKHRRVILNPRAPAHSKAQDLRFLSFWSNQRHTRERAKDFCQQWPGLEQRMVFMTGGAFTGEAHLFLQEVANPHLEKPFPMERLRALVDETCAPGR